MADYNTTISTNQANRATNRDAGASARALQMPVFVAGGDGSLSFTLASGVATNDNFILFYAEDYDCYVIPELSHVIDTGGSGDVDAGFVLEKVDSAGTVTALTGSAALDNNSAAFAALAAAPVKINRGDYIQATITIATGEAATAGETIAFRVALTSANR